MSAMPLYILSIAWIITLPAVVFALDETGRVYHDDRLHLNLRIPDDWRVYDQSEVKRSAADGDSIRPVKCDFLIMSRSASQLVPPYVVVQSRPVNLRDQPLSAVKQAITGESARLRAESQLSLRQLDVKTVVQDPELDMDRLRILSRSQFTMPDGRSFKGLSACVPGADAIVLIHAYSESDAFTSIEPVFQMIIDSARYDPGYQYQPVRSEQWRNAERTGAVIGVILGVTIVLIVVQLRSRANKSR